MRPWTPRRRLGRRTTGRRGPRERATSGGKVILMELAALMRLGDEDARAAYESGTLALESRTRGLRFHNPGPTAFRRNLKQHRQRQEALDW